MIYARIKKLVESGNFVKKDMLDKLDVFLIAGRITTEEYNEIVSKLD